MFRVVALVLFASLAVFGARAEDKPAFAALPDWVRVPAYKATPAKGAETAPVAVFLIDNELKFTPTGVTVFHEFVGRAQTAQGLEPMGALALEWTPETDRLVIHKVNIIRSGKVIDYLATGAGFTTLRRETKLENAMLDGALTAAAQIEGLEVGDVLDLAYSIERSDPTLKGKAEIGYFLNANPVSVLRVRAIWPSELGVRPWVSDVTPTPSVRTSGGQQEAELVFEDAPAYLPPKLAPVRYQRGREIWFSNFRDWAEVSSLLSAEYDRAASIKPGATLDAEAKAIAATTSDPKARAELALRLVEEKTRYVFIALNGGGLKPAAAETTWARRFGDCKGKTALLLALLRALGVEAEPAMVSTTLGDGLDAHPPTLSSFDHVLVRASISGKTYWLDGTRTGDRALDELAPPPYYWALPVRSSGSQLVRVELQPLRRPTGVMNVTLDASAGLSLPAPAHVEATYRGDIATGIQQQFANLTPDQLDRGLRAFWKNAFDFIEPKSVSAAYDVNTGEERLVIDGVAKLDWSGQGYEADGARVGWKADLKREAGGHGDAPYAVQFPSYEVRTESIKLPFGGRGFKVVGEDVNETVGGLELRRSARIAGETFTMETSSRSIVPEFPASQAEAVAKRLEELSKILVYVSPPKGASTAKEASAVIDSKPVTASEYVTRGNTLINAKRLDEALADLNKAVELDPKMSVAVADRAIVWVWKHEPAKARADIAAALALNPREIVAFRARALLAQDDGDWAGEVEAFSQALAIDPKDTYSLGHRAWALNNLERYQDALADAQTLLTIDPQDEGSLSLKGRILGRLHRNDEAAGIAQRLVAGHPDDPAYLASAAGILIESDAKAAARPIIDKALSIKPSAELYFERTRTRERSDKAGIVDDCEAALKLQPANANCTLRLINVYLAAKDYTNGLRWLDTAIQRSPDWKGLRADRGRIRMMVGRTQEAEEDFAVARTDAPDAQTSNTMCWARATKNVNLQAALDDCEQAVKLSPKTASIIDSKGFVLFRLGRYEDALAAYDAALAITPDLAASLYGRSLTEAKLGRKDAAERDRAAATAKRAEVVEDFKGYGVTPE